MDLNIDANVLFKTININWLSVVLSLPCFILLAQENKYICFIKEHMLWIKKSQFIWKSCLLFPPRLWVTDPFNPHVEYQQLLLWTNNFYKKYKVYLHFPPHWIFGIQWLGRNYLAARNFLLTFFRENWQAWPGRSPQWLSGETSLKDYMYIKVLNTWVGKNLGCRLKDMFLKRQPMKIITLESLEEQFSVFGSWALWAHILDILNVRYFHHNKAKVALMK